MGMKKDVDKLYDLIEKFNFNELSEAEKQFVLSQITESEYLDMRSTLGDTIRFFSRHPKEVEIPQKSGIKQFLTYRIELYKIAAVIILLLGIGFLIAQKYSPESSPVLASVDTVFIERIDTLILEKTVPLEKVRERIVYRTPAGTENSALARSVPDPSAQTTRDCAREICPEDLDQIKTLSRKNDFSHDRGLTEFMVALN